LNCGDGFFVTKVQKDMPDFRYAKSMRNLAYLFLNVRNWVCFL